MIHQFTCTVQSTVQCVTVFEIYVGHAHSNNKQQKQRSSSLVFFHSCSSKASLDSYTMDNMQGEEIEDIEMMTVNPMMLQRKVSSLHGSSKDILHPILQEWIDGTSVPSDLSTEDSKDHLLWFYPRLDEVGEANAEELVRRRTAASL